MESVRILLSGALDGPPRLEVHNASALLPPPRFQESFKVSDYVRLGWQFRVDRIPFPSTSMSPTSAIPAAAPAQKNGYSQNGPSLGSHDAEVGVGLSDPVQSESRRKLLDLVNRLHSTG